MSKFSAESDSDWHTEADVPQSAEPESDSAVEDDSLAELPTGSVMDRSLPAMIGPYFIERELGAGGMGTVYLGRHRETDLFAAVKLLPASLAREAGFVARFEREIIAMQKLQSPQIVQLLESGEDLGSCYYAMEYVAGETLAQRLEREKRIPWREAIEIAVQICQALKVAHNTGIVHRDLKPSNLLVRDDGVIKLTDFGIAQVFASGKLTVTGGILGTAEYMSPEQAQGKRATKQSDIYSLGAVLYVMLTGRPPFTGKSALDIIQKHKFSQFDSPRRLVPDIPFWLDEIVCKCLSKKPEERYPDAYVLSLRLQEVPRKVDMREGEASQVYLGDGTEETIVDSRHASEDPAAVGGTLVRDLFRAQLDSERASRGWLQWFDNTWVLVGLLLLSAVGVYGLSVLNAPSEQAMFERGVELMSRPAGPIWETARRDHFERLLQLNAPRWEPEVAPYLQQYEVYELRKQVLGRGLKQEDVPASEPEAIIRQSQHLRQQGRITEARQQLQALKELLSVTREFPGYLPLLDQLIEEMPNGAEATSLGFVEEALERAEELFQNGAVEQAISIWFSVKKLYDSRPEAAELVRRAQQRYLEVTGAELILSEDAEPLSDERAGATEVNPAAVQPAPSPSTSIPSAQTD